MTGIIPRFYLGATMNLQEEILHAINQARIDILYITEASVLPQKWPFIRQSLLKILGEKKLEKRIVSAIRKHI